MVQWDKLKYWRKMSVGQAIVVFGILLVPLIVVKALICSAPLIAIKAQICSVPDGVGVIPCSAMDAVIILCGAAFGALLGYDIQEHEKNKRQNCD